MTTRFMVGDLVRVTDSLDVSFPSREGRIISIDYLPDDPLEEAEYMVEFDVPVPNPHYAGNEEWEQQEYTEAYFTDHELEPRVRIPKKRTSGFGRFINRIEDDN